MLYRFMIGESRALRLLGDDDWTRRVGSANVKFILEKAAETAIPIDVTVEDPETHHRHREPIDNIECDGGCLQLLTAGSDMPIHSDSIDSAWAERKSTSTGVVISLVIVDRRSRPRFILTGQRPQCIAWRALIEWLLLKEAEAPAAA